MFPSLLCFFLLLLLKAGAGSKVMLVGGILSPYGCFGKTQMEMGREVMWVLAAITAEALSSL